MAAISSTEDLARTDAIQLLEGSLDYLDDLEGLQDSQIQGIFKRICRDNYKIYGQTRSLKSITPLTREQIRHLRECAQNNTHRLEQKRARIETLTKELMSEDFGMAEAIARRIVDEDQKNGDITLSPKDTKFPVILMRTKGTWTIIQKNPRGRIEKACAIINDSLRPCFIKKLPNHPNSISEYQVHYQLSGNRGILTLCGALLDDQSIYLILERGGGTVAGFVTNHPDEVLRCAFECANALQVVHEKRYIHRDVKGSNFIVVDGQVKLADFGASQPVEEVFATPAFMAPEYLLGHPNTDKVDVWAFGCLLIELYHQQNLEVDSSILPWGSGSPASSTVIDSDSDRSSSPSSSERSVESQVQGMKAFFLDPNPGWQDQLPDCGSPEINQLLRDIFQINPKDRPSMALIKERLLNIYTGTR